MIPPLLHPVAPLVPQVPVARARPAAGLPVPVPDISAPPTDVLAPTPAVATAPGTPGAIGPSDGANPAHGEDVLPSLDAPVYVEELPAVVKEVKPVYPQFARDAGVEGLVLVKVLVGKDGRVLDARLSEKDQVPMLNEAALDAARQWRFTPGLANGRPVVCWTAIPFRFRLH